MYKKIELTNLYEVIRKLDAKSIDATTRSKMLSNTIAAKRIATEIEEAKKTVVESISDEERKANDVITELQKKVKADANYIPTEEENKAAEVVKSWNKMFAEAIAAELNTEVEVLLKKITSDELDKIADKNNLTMDELVLLSEMIVE